MSMYYPNHLHKAIDMHKEEENVESEGKDQEYISQKSLKRSERGEGEDTEE